MRRILAIICYLLTSSLSYAATNQTQYIDWTTGCGGNDGTIGNPYCSCIEWEAQNTNLVVADVNLSVISSDSGSVSTTCTIDGWTTDATRAIAIDGLTISSTVATGGVLSVADPYVSLTNANLSKAGTDTGVIVLTVSAAAVVSFSMERSRIYHSFSGARNAEFVMVEFNSASGANVTFRNNFLWNFKYAGGTAVYVKLAASSTYNIENNSIIGSLSGGLESTVEALPSGTVLNIYNNVISADGNDYALSYGIGTLNSATNISADATSPDASFRSMTCSYTDSANGDLHLTSGATNCIDTGTTRSFTSDIDTASAIRPIGSAYEIGADEYSPAALPSCSRKGQKEYVCSKGQL